MTGEIISLRRRRLSRHLHQLGERAVDEFLAEVGEALGIQAEILARLERYEKLTAAMVRATGAECIESPPLLLTTGTDCGRQ